MNKRKLNEIILFSNLCIGILFIFFIIGIYYGVKIYKSNNIPPNSNSKFKQEIVESNVDATINNINKSNCTNIKANDTTSSDNSNEKPNDNTTITSNNPNTSNNSTQTNTPNYAVNLTLCNFMGGNYPYRLTQEQLNSIQLGENKEYENNLANYLVNNKGKTYDSSLNNLAHNAFNSEAEFKNNYLNYYSKYNSFVYNSFSGFIYHPNVDYNSLFQYYANKLTISNGKAIGIYTEFYKGDNNIIYVRGTIIYCDKI